MSSMDDLCFLMKNAATEINRQNPWGALHIFVEDGNCEDEDLESCLAQVDITEAEQKFCQRMLEGLTENQRYGAWALAQCSDAQAHALPSQGETK